LSKTKFYGLTGGIGAGKSTVAKLFSALNVPVLDLDKVGHLLLKEDKEVEDKLLQTFGESILNSGTSINRKALAKAAFSSATNTQRLNEILHPAIQAFEKKWRAKQVAPFSIIEASVLIESGDAKRMDALIVVLAGLDTRKQRVLARGKQDEVSFNAIVAQQCVDTTRRQLADFIIENNDSLKALHTLVAQLYKQL